MEIIFDTLRYHLTDSPYTAFDVHIKERRGRFWNSRKTIRQWTSKTKDYMPCLMGKIKTEQGTLLVELYILPRGKFNLLLGSNCSHGAAYESALVFHEKEFGVTKSRPSEIKKILKRRSKEIEAEVIKRINGEWERMNDEAESMVPFIKNDQDNSVRYVSQ